MEEKKRFSMMDSRYFQAVILLKDLVESGMPTEIAEKAIGILAGKTSMNGFPVCAPWSESAKTQATQFVWLNYYDNVPFYKEHEDVSTPFEKTIEKI